MNPIKILIVEDTLTMAEYLHGMLNQMGYEISGIASDLASAEGYLKQGKSDLVLIDINLNKQESGIDLAHLINQVYGLPFIYITSRADQHTVQQAKKTLPQGYLVKPFKKEDLYTSIEVAIINFNKYYLSFDGNTSPIRRDYLFVKDGHLHQKIKTQEVCWIKADRNYIDIHTLKKKYSIRSTIKNLMEKLPGNRFIRPHKSYLVNIEHISAAESTCLHVGKKTIPIGRAYQNEIKQHLSIQ